MIYICIRYTVLTALTCLLCCILFSTNRGYKGKVLKLRECTVSPFPKMSQPKDYATTKNENNHAEANTRCMSHYLHIGFMYVVNGRYGSTLSVFFHLFFCVYEYATTAPRKGEASLLVACTLHVYRSCIVPYPCNMFFWKNLY